MKSQGLCWLFTAGPILWLHHQSHYHAQWVSSWFSCWEASTRHRRREKPGYFFLVPPLLWHHLRADSYRSLLWTIRPAGLSLDPLTLRVAMSGSWQFLGAASLNLTLFCVNSSFIKASSFQQTVNSVPCWELEWFRINYQMKEYTWIPLSFDISVKCIIQTRLLFSFFPSVPNSKRRKDTVHLGSGFRAPGSFLNDDLMSLCTEKEQVNCRVQLASYHQIHQCTHSLTRAAWPPISLEGLSEANTSAVPCGCSCLKDGDPAFDHSLSCIINFSLLVYFLWQLNTHLNLLFKAKWNETLTLILCRRFPLLCFSV